MTRQERFVVILLVLGAVSGFSYSYYKKFYPPINIRFKRPFHEDTIQAKKIEELIEAETSVNLNSASGDELMRLKGIGPALAHRIMTYREEHGAFDSIEEIKNVHGIGEQKFRDIKDRITVE